MQDKVEKLGKGGGGGGGGAKWMGGCKGGGPPLATTRGYGGALQAPPPESGAEPQYPRKLMIFFLNPHVCRPTTYVHVHCPLSLPLGLVKV